MNIVKLQDIKLTHRNPLHSYIRVFSNQPVLHITWPKYWSFSFSISPSNEYSGLISFRMDWLDLLAVQGTFKSLLQHHSSEASILQCSAFLLVQLSHPYMTTGKTTALTNTQLYIYHHSTIQDGSMAGKISLCCHFVSILPPFSVPDYH